MTTPSKQKYAALCESRDSIPLFSQPWWLDSVCGPNNWDVTLVEKGGTIEAAMPYMLSKKAGFTVCGMPKLTQSLGPWLAPTEAKYANALGREKELMEALIDGLPSYNHFVQGWHTSLQNWLPFYWRGFEQTTRYTYVLQNISHPDATKKGMQEKVRRNLKKAQNRFNITVERTDDVDAFLELNAKTFRRQGLSLPYSPDMVKRIDAAANTRGCRQIYIGRDPEGRAHAGAYIAWDKTRAHYLMGGSDPALRQSEAGTLVLWNAIQDAAKHVDEFNFEGSMIEQIESYFRGFGGKQLPYFQLTHTPSKALRTAFFLRDLLKK